MSRQASPPQAAANTSRDRSPPSLTYITDTTEGSTFESPKLKHWVESRLAHNGVTSLLNPCAGTASLSTDADVLRVDVDEGAAADLHIDFRNLDAHVAANSFDGIVYDPPYTPNQARTTYDIDVSDDEFYFYDDSVFELFDRLLEPGGIFILFGYTTAGMPSAYGYTVSDVAVFNKLGAQNDYLGTVFQKPLDTAAHGRSTPASYRAHTTTVPNATAPNTQSRSISTTGNGSQPVRVAYHRRHPQTSYHTGLSDAVAPWVSGSDRVLHLYQESPSLTLTADTVITCRYTSPDISDPPAAPAVGDGRRQQANAPSTSGFVTPTPPTNPLPAVFTEIDAATNTDDSEQSAGEPSVEPLEESVHASVDGSQTPPVTSHDETSYNSDAAAPDYVVTPWNLSPTFATGVFDAVVLDLPYTAFQQTLRTPHEQATPGGDKTHVATAIKRGVSDIVSGETGRVIQIGRTATLMSGLEFNYTRAGVTVVHQPRDDADRIVSVDVKSHSNLETTGLPEGDVDRYDTHHITHPTSHPNGATSKHHRTDVPPSPSGHFCLHCGNQFYYHPALYRSCATCGALPGSHCVDPDTGRIHHTTIHDTRIADAIKLHQHQCHSRSRTELTDQTASSTQTAPESTATSLGDFN